MAEKIFSVLIVLVTTVITFFIFPNTVAAYEMEDDYNFPDYIQMQEIIEWDELDKAISEIQDYFSENRLNVDLNTFKEKIENGDFSFDLSEIKNFFLNLVFGDVQQCIKIFFQLLVLTVISAFLSDFVNSFGQNANGVTLNNSAEIGKNMVFISILACALQIFTICGTSVGNAVGLMSDFLYAEVPILLTLMVALGGITSVGVFHPVFTFSVAFALNMIRFFVMPLIYCCAGLVLASGISNSLSFHKLAALFRKVVLWSLTMTFTVFSVAIGIVGIGSASIDGIAMKTAKSTIGVFLPLVGRNIADLLGNLTGTALVLKNCLGVGGMLLIIIICLMPALKTLILSCLLKLGGAFAEPLGDRKLASVLTDLGDVVILFFASVTACGIFFFFLLAITLAMGNLNMAIC